MSSDVVIDGETRLSGYMMSFSYAPALMVSTAPERYRGQLIGMSVMTALSYIPGVSLIVGIARIIFSQIASMLDVSKAQDKEKAFCMAFKEAQVARGALECLSVFGPLLLIADIGITILVVTQD